MSWLFFGAFVLLIIGLGLFGVASSEPDILGGFYVLALALIAGGLFIYHWGVVGEVNCYRDGGQMISSQECVVISNTGGSK